MDGDSVTFTFDVVDFPQSPRLVVRCDASGEVYASIPAPRVGGTAYPLTPGE
jgi:hypothetical protein